MHILTVFCSVRMTSFLCKNVRYMELKTLHLLLSSSLMAPQFIAEPCLLNELLPVICVFDLSFEFPVLHLLMSVCTQFQNLFGHPVSWFLWGLLLNAFLTFLLQSILLTCPIQFNWLILTNESISTSPKSCINSLLYHFLHFHWL